MKQTCLILIFSFAFLCHAQLKTDSLTAASAEFPNDSATDKNSFSLNGQITGWTIFEFSDPTHTQAAGRFVPVFTGIQHLKGSSRLDFEASLNIQGALHFTGNKFDSATYVFKPYRVWLRYAGNNWEIRGGLQKINFGTARMFRPLMWFDQMDVRDPLQLTDGVYGVLGKYFFANNLNIWLWTLMGNKNPKGFEMFGSAAAIPEIGGRIETPLGPGEMAFSTHFRKADLHTAIPAVAEKTYINERRMGLDGKWDIGPGIWFEASISMFEKTDLLFFRFQDMWNAGADYTLPIGAGLNVTAEYFRLHFGDKILKEGTTVNFFGSMITYPVSIIDNVSAMVFYAKETGKFFNYISYARTYDNWNFYVIGFWNPENNLPIGIKPGGRNLFAGKGVQLMASFNF